MKNGRSIIIASLLLLVISTSLIFTGCGIPQSELDAAIAEKDALQSQLDTANAAKTALQSDLDTANAAKSALQSQLDELNAVYPLKGFDTLSDFKTWITAHVQPETQYIRDAFLAAYAVQQAGMADGYLMGLDIDTFEGSTDMAVYITVFVGNDLYWWFVEDAEDYGDFGLSK